MASLPLIPRGTYRIKSGNSTNANAYLGRQTDGFVTLQDSNSSLPQQWSISPSADGDYRIASISNTSHILRTIDTDALVCLPTRRTVTWTIEPRRPDAYVIGNASNTLAIHAAQDGRVIAAPRNNRDIQRWILDPNPLASDALGNSSVPIFHNGSGIIVNANGPGKLHVLSFESIGGCPNHVGYIETNYSGITRFLISHSYTFERYAFYWEGNGTAVYGRGNSLAVQTPLGSGWGTAAIVGWNTSIFVTGDVTAQIRTAVLRDGMITAFIISEESTVFNSNTLMFHNGNGVIVSATGPGKLHVLSFKSNAGWSNIVGYIETNRTGTTRFVISHAYTYERYAFYWEGSGPANYAKAISPQAPRRPLGNSWVNAAAVHWRTSDFITENVNAQVQNAIVRNGAVTAFILPDV